METETKTEDLASWLEFQDRVAELVRSAGGDRPDGLHHSKLLFRGQADAVWSLQTTLERSAGGNDLHLRKYHLKVVDIQYQVESATTKKWAIPTYPEYETLLARGGHQYPLADELYDFLIYLRHHGFPSPLLDWSASQYIAAFFAFRSDDMGEKVAIFAYQEYAGSAKGGFAARPRIHEPGSNTPGHPRHHLQQSQYTMAFEDEDRDLRYCSHERAFAESAGANQDLLWKFTLPAELRQEVLRDLQLYNLTAYSLFGSEESLMESLAVEQFVLEQG